MPTASKFSSATPGLDKFQSQVDALTNELNPFAANANQIGQIPFYGTGARAFIKVGGKAIAVAQDLKWNISFQPNPIYTIDSVIPWDIDVGPLTITGTLSIVVDPTSSPEATSLLMGTMSSAVHAPLAEIQALDKSGTSLFFSRGMFTSVSGSVSRGQLSSISCQFTGIAFQSYVAQGFTPYNSIASGLSGLVSGLGNLASNVSGGIL